MIARVPASSANMGPGFDALGLALSLHLEAATELPDDGPGWRAEDEHHPTTVAFRVAGGDGPVWVRSPIPMGRGLGFSGAARVAGLLLAAGQRDGVAAAGAARDDLLAAASALEGHADNAAASLHGGVVATARGVAVQVPMRFDPVVVCWVPSDHTLTDESRAKVARPIEFDDAVFNVGRVALLVAALAAGDVGALRVATEDRLHQDLRLESLPESRAALAAALDAGVWCGWLSGSGPTIATLCAHEHAERIAAALPPGASVKSLRIDHEGAVLEP